MREILQSISDCYPQVLTCQFIFWLLGGLLVWLLYHDRDSFIWGGAVGVFFMTLFLAVSPLKHGNFTELAANLAVAVPTFALALLLERLSGRREARKRSESSKP